MHGMQEAEGKWRRGRVVCAEKKKGPIGPAALISGRRENKRGRCLYRGDRESLACASREGRWRIGLQRKEKRAGLLVWAENVFPIFFLFQKDSINLI